MWETMAEDVVNNAMKRQILLQQTPSEIRTQLLQGGSTWRTREMDFCRCGGSGPTSGYGRRRDHHLRQVEQGETGDGGQQGRVGRQLRLDVVAADERVARSRAVRRLLGEVSTPATSVWVTAWDVIAG